MLTTVFHILWQNESQAVFVMIGYVFHSTDVSATRKVRNGCTVMSEIAVQSINRKIYIVCTQVEKDINTGVFILRTVDLTVCILALPHVLIDISK